MFACYHICHIVFQWYVIHNKQKNDKNNAIILYFIVHISLNNEPVS